MLKDRGVDVIFGIPGVHNQEMYRGIEEAGITHVLARHEQGAGFMADGYARATGRPGVAYVITGPGLCNIMTPMGQAYSDSVPMLVISSCLDETAARRGQLHQMKDQRAAAETVCDWSHEARSAEAAYALIDRALVEFETERMRPKHVQVPIGVLEGMAAISPYASRFERWGPQRPQRDEYASTQVAKALKEARRPIIVFGGGATLMGRTLCTKLAMASKAATFETYAGRGLIGPDHSLHLGSMLARPDSASVLATADLVVVIGSELAEVDLWRKELGHSCKTIRIDEDPENLAGLPQEEVEAFCVSSYPMMEATWELIKDAEINTDWSDEEVIRLRQRWRAEVDAEYPGVLPVADALKACLPDGTMIYSDMTQFAYASKEVWDMDEPGHWHHPYGFGTLGYALPAAIGGAVGRDGQPTIAIMGDYGFHYTMAELGVAVELGLPIPIILWDNGKLGAIEASMVGAQIAPNAVIARNPDFVKLAEAFGAAAVKPGSLDEMQAAVRQAFSAAGPTLIHVTPDIA
ncbi:thiamine pyrophosphate-binding protein [Sulfitobacter sediminilitoris]